MTALWIVRGITLSAFVFVLVAGFYAANKYPDETFEDTHTYLRIVEDEEPRVFDYEKGE